MTSETRTLFETEDISGLEIECPDCHIKTIYPISECLTLEAQCRNCPKRLFDATSDKQTGHNIYPAIETIRELVGNLWALGRTRTDIHAHIRLQIKTTSKPLTV